MERTSSPAVDRARTADSRPAPGPLTATSTVRSPDSFALFAAVKDACCAAKGVPFRDPRKPSEPELDHEITLPMGSVMVTIVLLNDACTCTRPMGTLRFSFFLNAFFLVVFAGAFAIYYPYVLAADFFLFVTVRRGGRSRVRRKGGIRRPRTGKPQR